MPLSAARVPRPRVRTQLTAVGLTVVGRKARDVARGQLVGDASARLSGPTPWCDHWVAGVEVRGRSMKPASPATYDSTHEALAPGGLELQSIGYNISAVASD
jgi:hypothetical protein